MVPTSTSLTFELSSKLPVKAQAVAILLHKEQKNVDASIGIFEPAERDQIRHLINANVNSGKSNEVFQQLLAGGGKNARRLFIIGLGSSTSFSAQCLREAGVALARACKAAQVESAALVLPELPETLPGYPGTPTALPARPAAVEAVALGFSLGAFVFEECKGKLFTDAGLRKKPKSLAVITGQVNAGLKTALLRGQIIGEAQNFARTIATRPGNEINPPSLARLVERLGRELPLKVRTLDEKEQKKLGMGGLLAVGGGSPLTPPRLIAIEYAPKKSRSKKPIRQSKPFLVVGKSITFDTGGISIKPAQNMQHMIFDKCGGMAVLGLMYALARLQPDVHVVGLLSSAENHVSDTAYRPGDVLKMHNGVTVEITNTDAEGRLVLADALSWGIQTYQPRAVVNLATLTGGVIVALGRSITGLMSRDDALSADLNAAADRAGERVWRLPLGEEASDLLKSNYADLANSGGRDAHVLQGGAFLSHFVPETVPWAHLDIAGTANSDKDTPLYGKGATGWGVRTLLEWIAPTKE